MGFSLRNLDDEEKKKKKKDFGKRLQALRKPLFKTQDVFADIVGVSEETIRNWEQGRNYPDVEQLVELSILLNCDVDYLLGNIDCKTVNAEYIHKHTGLSEHVINLLHEWENCEGNHHLRISYINSIMEHEKFDYLMDSINSLMSHSHIEGIAFVMNDKQEIMDSMEFRNACLYRISNIFDGILNQISTQYGIETLKRWEKKKAEKES